MPSRLERKIQIQVSANFMPTFQYVTADKGTRQNIDSNKAGFSKSKQVLRTVEAVAGLNLWGTFEVV